MLRQIWVRLVRLIGSEGAEVEPKKTRTSDDDIIVLHQISHCLEDILESDDDIVLPSIHTVPFMIFG